MGFEGRLGWKCVCVCVYCSKNEDGYFELLERFLVLFASA